MLRPFFPVCASFGPLFIAMGTLFPNRGTAPIGFFIAIPGALMTSAALLVLYRILCNLEGEKPAAAPSTTAEPTTRTRAS